MALAKFYEDIVEARRENRAAIVLDYQYPQENAKRVASSELPDGYLTQLRLFVRRAIKKSEERLSREKTLVYKLNEQRTKASTVGYITKGEAAKIARGVAGGDILDLDDVYGGVLVRAGYLFISETKLVEGLRRYGSDVTPAALIDGLTKERLAEIERLRAAAKH